MNSLNQKTGFSQFKINFYTQDIKYKYNVIVIFPG